MLQQLRVVRCEIRCPVIEADTTCEHVHRLAVNLALELDVAERLVEIRRAREKSKLDEGGYLTGQQATG